MRLLPPSQKPDNPDDPSRPPPQMSWTGEPTRLSCRTHSPALTTPQPFRAEHHHGCAPTPSLPRALPLTSPRRRPRAVLRLQGRPGHIHGLPHDGRPARKGPPPAFLIPSLTDTTSPPNQWINDIADAGGSLYCFHIEAASPSPLPSSRALTSPHLPPTADPIALIDAIHDRKMKAGVAISPDTPSSAITDDVAELADMLLVMTVYPGPCTAPRHAPSADYIV